MPVTEEMVAAMNGARPKAAYMGCDLLCVFDDADTVRNMTVDQDKVRALDGLLLHVTAPGTDVDCVSRSFAPKCNVAEDPVCGSGHCHIVPYWVQTLGKDTLVADQASRRGGTLYCTQPGLVLGGICMRDREEKRFLCAGAVRERCGLFSRPDAVRIRHWMKQIITRS